MGQCEKNRPSPLSEGGIIQKVLMKIYFCCAVTGGRDQTGANEKIVAHLLRRGHIVPTEHLVRSDALEPADDIDPEAVYRRDIAWIDDCDALIAEVSMPSHGVGYEIAYALGQKKRVFCCSRRGLSLSKMITGNDSPSLVVRTYEKVDEVLELMDMFLSELEDEIKLQN